MSGFAEFLEPVPFMKRILGVKYPRRKPREMVTRRRGEAATGMRTPLKAEALGQLEQAASFLDATAKSDSARKYSIQNAEPFYDKACALLEQDKKTQSAPPTPPPTVPLETKLSTEDEKRRTTLLEDVGKVEQQIIKLHDKAGVGPVRFLAPAEKYEFTLMMGAAQSIRIHLANAIDGGSLEKINGELVSLQKTCFDLNGIFLDAATKFSELQEHSKTAETTLVKLKEVPGTKPELVDGCKLATLLKTGQEMIGGGLVSVDGVATLDENLVAENEKASSNLQGYVGGLVTEAGLQEKIDKAQEIFDKELGELLKQAGSYAGALDNAKLLEAATDAKVFRGNLPKFMAETPDALNGEIKTLKQRLATALEEGRKAQAELAKQARDGLGKVLGDADKFLTTIKDNKAFATDMKAIDNLTQSINGLLDNHPETDPGERIKALQAAALLIEELKERIAKSGKARGAMELPEKIKQLETDIGNAKEFKEYKAEELDELKNKLGNLKNGLSTMFAPEAADALAELRQSFTAKDAESKQIKQLIADQKPRYKNWASAANPIDVTVPGEENCFDPVLSAYEAATKARPAVKADIEKAFAALEKAFSHPPAKEGDTPASMGVDEIRQKLETEQVGIKKKLAKAREDLTQRVKALRERLDTAEEGVKKAKGDTNPVDTVKRLFEDAETEIKGKTPEAAKQILDRAEQRILLIQVNPEGGLARKRMEIPTLRKQWEDARSFAAQALKELHAQLLSYEATGEDREKREEAALAVCGFVLEYARSFADGPDPLANPLRLLADAEQPETIRRKAREEAAGVITDLQRRLQAHPLSRQLAGAPFPNAARVPVLLMQRLDALSYIVLTSVG